MPAAAADPTSTAVEPAASLICGVDGVCGGDLRVDGDGAPAPVVVVERGRGDPDLLDGRAVASGSLAVVGTRRRNDRRRRRRRDELRVEHDREVRGHRVGAGRDDVPVERAGGLVGAAGRARRRHVAAPGRERLLRCGRRAADRGGARRSEIPVVGVEQVEVVTGRRRDAERQRTHGVQLPLEDTFRLGGQLRLVRRAERTDELRPRGRQDHSHDHDGDDDLQRAEPAVAPGAQEAMHGSPDRSGLRR